MRITIKQTQGILNNNLSLILWIIIYRVLLDWAYFGVITKQFAYLGFHDNRTFPLLLLSWIILLLSFVSVRKVFFSLSGRNSEFIVSVLYLFSFVPFTSCIYAGILSGEYIFANCIYWFALIYAERLSMTLPIKRLPILRLGKLQIDDSFVTVFGVLSMLLVLSISARYTHFRLNFNLSRVYDLRSEASNYAIPGFVQYLFAWTRAINPILFGYCLIKRKPWFAVLYFFTQMLSFGIDGLKSTFFMPFLVLSVVLFYNRISARRFKLYLAGGLTVLMLVAGLEYMLFRSSALIELIVRRVMFIPNYLGRCYYDFFQTNVPDYFRGSFLRYFGFKSPYTTGSGGITYIIGSVYFGRASMNCNNGLISDAITNLGKPGLVLMPIILVLVLRLFDRSTMHLDKRISAATALYLSYVILSTFLMTVLLTHGMLVLILLLSMIDEKELQGYEKN